MAALRPLPPRRRARRGSLDRPVNARMYRGTWLLVGIPLLVGAFTVLRPEPLRPPTLPPTFDEVAAVQLAEDFAKSEPDRSPGSEGARDAATWVGKRFTEYGFHTESDRFPVKIPGRGRVELENLLAIRQGRSAQAIAVVAHRDNSGSDQGANDNASGTGALLELARSYATPRTGPRSPEPNHTILFLSTDGGVFGGLGAERFARHSPYRDRVVAVVNLDSIAGKGAPRLVLAGDGHRAAAATFVRTAAARVFEQTGREPVRTSAIGQLIDLAFPFSLYEQAPFAGAGIAAVTLTSAGERPPRAFGDSDLNGRRLAGIGHAAQALVASLDEEVEPAEGTSSYLYLGSRVVRGWVIVFILCAALLPGLAAIVDLFARVRRRHIPLAPALRSYRSRLAFWLFAAMLFGLFALTGIWQTGAARPLPPEDSPGTQWPLAALAAFAFVLSIGWFLARDRLLPRRPISEGEVLAGHTAALLALGVVALLLVAMNPFSVLFVLPSLHAWIWLPQVRSRPLAVQATVLAAGFAGPLALLSSFAFRLDLGLDAPWYVAQLAAVGYVPFASILVLAAWLAAAAQLTVLCAGRYAPYPSAAERPRSGPARRLVRAVVVAARDRRRPAQRDEAVGG